MMRRQRLQCLSQTTAGGLLPVASLPSAARCLNCRESTSKHHMIIIFIHCMGVYIVRIGIGIKRRSSPIAWTVILTGIRCSQL